MSVNLRDAPESAFGASVAEENAFGPSADGKGSQSACESAKPFRRLLATWGVTGETLRLEVRQRACRSRQGIGRYG
ncbi:hypothetical protein HAP94_01585 [Acidithiobacillus ferrivorans]|nr:hypothetical protein [Acidithiobacillus ferrivorans]